MTRVLVVDGSRFVRRVVADVLCGNGYEVQTETTIDDALERVLAFDPDVITLDGDLLDSRSTVVVNRIMSVKPTPILVLTAPSDSNPAAALGLLDNGAVDVVRKPDPSETGAIATLIDRVEERIDVLAEASISTLALAQATAAANRAGPANARRMVVTTGETHADTREEAVPLDGTYVEHPTFILGASTGGPKLVEQILERLPTAIEAKGVVVQHMPKQFTSRFAERLDDASEYAVTEAEEETVIGPGEIAVAPGGYHLEVVGNENGHLLLECSDSVRKNGVRPSIDVAMCSAAETVDDPLVGVVLSGMGADGAEGIRAISTAGGVTFAQDESTSAVFGIPGKAIETGCVDEVVPADQIPDRLVSAFSTDGEYDG